ncbi:MAG TPA: bifunctional (p)ppGpp synthetase/guanosine-3',5'-bis(diphosphate) 3'-pyrophosphohydrolase, partial [Tenericutes bacterium]|nr:bifunctional (p)ppGpp synthetase/guanosine-3',5'-bis(diphosphate) 3'-pyrophosphohydrolase [Mycoplasmatota bacterium]
YSVYQKIKNNYNLYDIHNLIAIRVIVDDIKACYHALGNIHSIYHPFNEKFKDYISLPRTNMYSSIHTTLFGPEERFVQAQIRTKDMERINNYGLTAYWHINKGLGRLKMQEDLTKKFQFVKSLNEINSLSIDNSEFVYNVKKELFNKNIYVYNAKGEVIELPEDSTPIDFAYRVDEYTGNKIISAFVNDELVALNHKLKNQDRIKIITADYSIGPKIEWIDQVKTVYAKRKIQEHYRNNKNNDLKK